MEITGRRLMLGASVLLALIGIVVWPTVEGSQPRGALALVTVGLLGIVGITFLWRRPPRRLLESNDMHEISESRQRELMRGTSMHLRELKYPYSVRFDRGSSADRQCFTAEVGTITLGFVPAVVMENTTERQGLGYIAFVHDGYRWRGPGLPCPAEQSDAVRHATRCVSPLATDDQTHVNAPSAVADPTSNGPP